MKSTSYYFGLFTGWLFSAFLVVYAFYDGYENYINGRSIAGDIAMLFAFFTWQKVTKLYYLNYDWMMASVFHDSLNQKEE